jgi:hypothetical protein
VFTALEGIGKFSVFAWIIRSRRAGADLSHTLERKMKRREFLFMFALVIAVGALLLLTGTTLARRGSYIRIDSPNIEPVEACTNSIEFGFALEDNGDGLKDLWASPEAPSSIEVTATVRISDTGEVVATSVFSADIVKPDFMLVEVTQWNAIEQRYEAYTTEHYWVKNEVAVGDSDYISGTTLENGNVNISWSEAVPVGTQLAVGLETGYTYDGTKPWYGEALYPNGYEFSSIEEFITKSCAAVRIYLPLVLKSPR